MKFSLPLELKASDIAGSGEFTGYAGIFGNVDLGGDSIQPGAFAQTLADHKARGTVPALLWSHDPSIPLGRLEELQEDRKGLFARGKLTLETRAAAEAYALLKDRAVGGLSIGYSLPKGGAEYDGETRLLKRLDLHEVSIVAVPMNPAARITAVKALDCADVRELEHVIREALGLSSRKAKAIAGAAWPILKDERDAHADEREAREARTFDQLVVEIRTLNQLLSKGR